MKKKVMNNKHHHSRTLTMSLFFFLLLQVLPYATAQGSHLSLTPPNQSFKTSMTITIVVLVVSCVIIAFFSFYIRRCVRDIHMDGMGSVRLTRTRTRPAPRGLDPTLIETFPTFLYSVVKGLKIGKEVLECVMCLNEFEEDKTLRLLPQFNHVFNSIQSVSTPG
ncbi:hypothetical protein IFM89_037502 [Coptis chinensis]|uniref:RING-type E3 ubiquitin transferase n=1 Tax=Coptis chinensis TaxID=261450 RepID=A0A835ISL4_9MAGN|nr:hypothetical protein IFM89_037502 [Coptis chinensis]